MALTFILVLMGLFSAGFLFPKKLEWKRWLIIAGIIVLVFAASGLMKSGEFVPSDEEWEEVYLGKTIGENNDSISKQARRGALYPMLIHWTNGIYEAEKSPVILNNIFVILSVLFVFGAIYKLVGNKLFAFLGSSLLLLNPIWEKWSIILEGYPAMMGCLLAGWSLFMIAFIREKKIEYFSGIISFSVLLSMGKIEYAIFLVPAIVVAIVSFNKRKIGQSAAMIALSAISLVPSVVFSLGQRRGSVGFCGLESRVGLVSDKINRLIGLPGIDFLETIVKAIGGWRFSLAYLIDDIPTVIGFWMEKDLIMVTVLALIGVTFSLLKKDKAVWITFLSFILIISVYATDCATYVPRYASPQVIIMTILATYALYCLYESWRLIWPQKGTRNRRMGYGLASLISLAVVISFIPGIKKNINYLHRDSPYATPSALENVLNRLPDAKAFVIVHRTEAMEMMVFDNKNRPVIILNDLFDRQNKIKESDDICASAKSLCKEGTYFIKTESCTWFEVSRIACNKMSENGKIVKSDGGMRSLEIYQMGKETK